MEITSLLINKGFIDIATKVFFLVSSFLFTLFLLVVVRQIISMNAIINDENDSIILKLVAFILLLSSVSLFLTALVIL